MPDNELVQAVALALTAGIGWKTIHRLLEHFETLSDILTASEKDLQSVPGIGPKTAAALSAIDLPHVEADLARFAAQAIGVLTWRAAEYPVQLAGLKDAPLALFYRGDLKLSGTQTIAIVGTREATSESLQMAEALAAEFAVCGWLVISGMARGIDTAAHGGALNAGGRTIAVLGCGVNVVYPPENHALADTIRAHGALLSEYHPNCKVSPSGLTIRNRIISGLSRATIVIEAGAASGALYAARKAHTQGRMVFAVNNGSAGNAALLADYALPAESAAQIIQHIDKTPP